MSFSPASCARLLSRGDFADLYLEETSHLTLRREDGRLDDAIQGESSGAGLRALRGREVFYAHQDCRRPLARGLAKGEIVRLEALAADWRLPGRRIKLPAGAPPLRAMPAALPPQAVPLEEKAALLERAEKAARRAAAVRQVSVTYGERVKRVGYVNSRGEICAQELVYVVFVVEVTAEKGGLRQTAYESVGGAQGFELFRRTPPEKVAEAVAARALAKLAAPPAPLGEMPVVIASSAGGTLIHEAIGHALEADAIQDGTSPHFAGKIGRKVASEKVSVVDDPTLSGHRGSFVYDDEGIPAQRTALVEDGVLKTYLYDRRSAARHRRASNGHGRRESYAHPPIPRMSNIFVAPGTDSPEDILKSLRRGVLVTRMGGGQVNTATGDFVFEVEEGFRVEDGRVKHMVRGASLLGNGPDVLRSIDRVGWDIGWAIGTCGKEGQGVPVSDGVPTLRIPKLVIGGTNDDK